MSKDNEKDIERIKSQFAFLLIDQICNNGERLHKILEMMKYISMNSICIKLLSYLLQAHAVEDFESVLHLKNEFISFLEVDPSNTNRL